IVSSPFAHRQGARQEPFSAPRNLTHEVTRMDLSSASIALRLLVVFALVAANGLFVAAEFSIVKARRTRIAQLVRQGRRGARLVQRATENPEPFVAATQLGITMASFGLRAPHGRHVAYQRDELVMLVGEARRAGTVEREEESLVRRVFRLTDRVVGEVMVHRTAIAAVPATATVRDAVAAIRQRGFTRLPVIGEDRDHIVGAVHAKDLLIQLADGRDDAPITGVVRPVFYVPETKPVVDLLEEMRHGRSQMAVVLEEYGSTAGIVTIEDLLEEIVGEIPGEYRPQPQLVDLTQPDRILVDASIDLATL